MLGAAEALGAAVPFIRIANIKSDYENALFSAQKKLGEKAFATLCAEGQAMTLEEAIEYALSDDD